MQSQLLSFLDFPFEKEIKMQFLRNKPNAKNSLGYQVHKERGIVWGRKNRGESKIV